MEFLYNIFQRLGLATSNLVSKWGFPRLIIKSHAEERMGVALGYGSSPKFGVLFNIYTMAEASNFKFGTRLGFANAHHKITPSGKVGMTLGQGSSRKF